MPYYVVKKLQPGIELYDVDGPFNSHKEAEESLDNQYFLKIYELDDEESFSITLR